MAADASIIEWLAAIDWLSEWALRLMAGLMADADASGDALIGSTPATAAEAARAAAAADDWASMLSEWLALFVRPPVTAAVDDVDDDDDEVVVRST